MHTIFLDRKFDSTPGYGEHQRKRIKWLRQHGRAWMLDFTEKAQQEPEIYFSRIAELGSRVVGFANAEALPGQPYCWLRGLMVAREFEGQGVGQHLQESRQQWAEASGRPVRGLIACSNLRSMDFFSRQGFVEVDIQEPTAELPMRLAIMEQPLQNP